jgi:hypothetical protein
MDLDKGHDLEGEQHWGMEKDQNSWTREAHK